jgi:hypothetical protein
MSTIILVIHRITTCKQERKELPSLLRREIHGIQGKKPALRIFSKATMNAKTAFLKKPDRQEKEKSSLPVQRKKTW